MQPAALDQEVQSQHLRHALVRDDDREVPLLQQCEGFQRARTGDDVVFLAFKGFLERAEYDGFVIHNQNGGRGGGRIH